MSKGKKLETYDKLKKVKQQLENIMFDLLVSEHDLGEDPDWDMKGLPKVVLPKGDSKKISKA